MKTNDILIAAYPKSGITYLGFMLCAARLHRSEIALTPTMFNIDFLLIDTHKMGNIPPGSIWNDGIGDFYKTHSDHVNAPSVIYLLRNPVDTLRSYFHFTRQLGGTDTVQDFLAREVPTWKRHVRSWLVENRNASQSIHVVEYEKLVSDAAGELEYILDQLGLAWDGEDIAYGLAVSDQAMMRSSEDEYAARNPVYSKFNLEFVRKGNKREVAEFEAEAQRVDMELGPLYRSVLGALK